MSDSSIETRMDTSSGDALTTLWYFFTSSRWAALLLALLALTAVLAALDPHLRTFGSSALSQGGTTAHLGTLSVRGSMLNSDSVRFLGGLWLRVLLALFAFTLLLRLVDRFLLAFGSHPNVTHMQQTFLPHVALYHGPAPSKWTVNEIREHVSKWPGARLMRNWTVVDETGTGFCAENVRFMAWGDWLLHLGLLIVIIGLFVSAQWGWREDNITLAAGETYALDHAAGYVLNVEQAQASEEAGKSMLSLTTADGKVQGFALSALQPHLTAFLTLFQVSTGPALTLSATEDSGGSLWLQPLAKGANASSKVTLKFTKGQEEAYLFVPDVGVTLRIVRYHALPEEGFAQPVYLLRGYRGTQSSPLFNEYITTDTTFRWQTLTFSTGLTHYLVVNAVFDWGWWLVLTGLLLLLIGTALNRWSSPWLVCFRTEHQDVEPLVFERVTLWGRNSMADHGLAFVQTACENGGFSEP